MRNIRNRGQVLVFFALSLVVLIGLAAFGIDVGYMYTVRHELQRCADAGALAGASRFINAPGETGSWADSAVQNEARARAIDYATRDDVVQTKLLTQPGDNVIVTFDQGPDRIKVQTERTVPLFFSKLFLGLTKRISAYAVAEAASVSENTTCIAPLAVPMPWIEGGGNPYAYDDPSDTVSPIDNTLEGICQGFNGSGAFTTWNYPTHDNGTRSARDSYLCPGALMRLKIGSPSETQPGWFRPLDLSDYALDCDDPENNSAPKLYTWLLKHGADCTNTTGCRVVLSTNDPSQELNVLTGDRVGPTVQAIAPQYYATLPGGGYPASIDWDSVMDGRENPSDPANYTEIDNYNDPNADWDFLAGNPPPANGPQSNVTSRRIWRLPVYDPRVAPVGHGSNMYISPVKFVGFWIQDVSPINAGQATITGRLLEITGVGQGGPDPGPGGATVKILRLVE